MKRFLMACVLAAVPFSGFADARDDCADAGDEGDIYDCLWAIYEQLDADLNTQYQKTIAIFEERMAAQPSRAPELVDRLRIAQRAWVAYRDANCKMYIWGYEETHQQNFWEEECLTQMTTARLEELVRFQEPGFQEDTW